MQRIAFRGLGDFLLFLYVVLLTKPNHIPHAYKTKESENEATKLLPPIPKECGSVKASFWASLPRLLRIQGCTTHELPHKCTCSTASKKSSSVSKVLKINISNSLCSSGYSNIPSSMAGSCERGFKPTLISVFPQALLFHLRFLESIFPASSITSLYSNLGREEQC